MAGASAEVHGEPMDIIVLVCTGLVFLALVAAIPLALGEARQDEDDARLKR